MENKILAELRRLEKEESVRVLYAVESGSRAWGFASMDSDWDVRFIYVHNLKWYLSIKDKKDSLERMLEGGLDLSGWEGSKALKMFKVSNPPLMEWLESPMVYVEETDFAESLRNLGKEFFLGKSAMYHYLAMARNNWKSYFGGDKVKVKKYFYVLRPVLACEWIRTRGQMAPMEFDKLLELVEGGNLKNRIIELLEQKRSGKELGEGKKIGEIDAFLQGKIEFLEGELRLVEELGKKPKVEDLDEILQKSIMG